LIERWSLVPDLKVEAFVRAKIRESRLLDFHPIYGGTQAGGTGAEHLPPMTEGLFRLDEVEAIEAKDFADDHLAPSEGDAPAPTVGGAALDSGSLIAVLSNLGDEALTSPNVPTELSIYPIKNEAENFDLEIATGSSIQDVGGEASPVLAQTAELQVGSPEWRKRIARTAANAMHSKSGGSRDKQTEIRKIWASGKYSDRNACAEQECAALDMAFSTARKALVNTPDPDRCGM